MEVHEMGLLVTMGAPLMCSFGAAPSTLVVLPTKMAIGGGTPLATITDMAPLVNIPPFGMCMSLANPMVAAATAAALGVLTPMPCIPVTTGPWMPGSPLVQCGGVPVVNDTSKCMCAYGGVISIAFAGQPLIQVP
jgi:hypothetical protein